MWREKKRQMQGRTKRRMSVVKILTYFEQLLRNLLRKFTVLIAWRERKDILYSCGDIFDEKYREKEKWINIGKNEQENAGFNPTIQLVVVYLYTKYEHSILNGCGDIFDEKVLRNYGGTDGRKDGQM